MVRKTNRIEPTLSGDNNQQSEPIPTSAQSSQPHYHRKNSQTNPDLQQKVFAQLESFYAKISVLVKNKILASKKNTIIAASTFFAIVLIFIIISFVTSSSEPIETIEPEINEANISNTINLENRSHSITLPDNFSLMATDYNGIVIHWQAESNSNTKIWDIHTTDGDESCQEVKFNNGEKYRTLNVLVENEKDYFANFSPLDTPSIIKAIALRGNFSLCSYKFSLKGSQAVLGKHYYYSDMLSY